MLRNSLYALVVILFSFNTGAYAEQTAAKITNHKEWVTGPLKIKYTLTTSPQRNNSNRKPYIFKHINDLKEYVHAQPIISSIDTIYHPIQVITKINSNFLAEFENAQGNGQGQFFIVHRQTCIDSLNGSNSSATCVNTEDTVLVDAMQIIDIHNIQLDAYNLPPGTYLASTEMYVQPITFQANTELAYLTTGDQIQFTIKTQ